MRFVSAIVLGTCLVGSGCAEETELPPYTDGGWGNMGTTIPSGGTSRDGGSDGSVQDGGTERCTAEELELVDSPGATGTGFSVAAQGGRFVVSWALRNPALVPASNVYARSVATSGVAGTTNAYLVTDAPVGFPVVLPRTSGILLAFAQLFSEVGSAQIDVVTQHLDLDLGADSIAQRVTITSGEELGLDGVSTSDTSATVAMITASVDPTSQATTTSLAFGELDVDGFFSYGPVEIAGTSDVTVPPAVATLGGVPHAAFRRGGTGVIELVPLTHPGTPLPLPVAVATGGRAIDVDGDGGGGALVFDSVSGGRSVVRFLPLTASGNTITTATDVNAAPIAGRDGAVALLGLHRLVVYRGTVDGTTVTLRAAYLDAVGRVLSDQAVTGAIAAEGQVAVASLGTDRALAVHASSSSTGTVSSPGYRLRAVLLECR